MRTFLSAIALVTVFAFTKTGQYYINILQQLAISGMDFNAALVKRSGRKRFADPKLEAKVELWKRCFRSGKETIEPARAYAQQWLKELN